MSDKRPAFQRYPKDYLSDPNTFTMTLEQEGAYNRLMDFCWLNRSIPDDPRLLAPLCKLRADRPEDLKRMESIWEAIRKCFRKRPRHPGEMIHPRLETERRKQNAFKKAKSEAGKRGAKAKWDKVKNGNAIDLPLAKDGFSSAFASATADIKKETKKAVALPEGWEPTEAHRLLAKEEGVDCDREAFKFRNHAQANGRTQRDWNAAFRNWLVNARRYGGEPPPPPIERAGSW